MMLLLVRSSPDPPSVVGGIVPKARIPLKLTKVGVDVFIRGLVVLVLGVVAFLGWDWLQVIRKRRKRHQRQREHRKREEQKSVRAAVSTRFH